MSTSKVTYSVSPTGEILIKLDEKKTYQLLGLINANRHHNPGVIDRFVSSCLHEATRSTYSKPRILN